jgi:hypothetical protein
MHAFTAKNMHVFTITFILSMLQCMLWGWRKAEERNLNFLMVKTDPLHIVLHNVMVYKNVTMMLNEDLLYFSFRLKTATL